MPIIENAIERIRTSRQNLGNAQSELDNLWRGVRYSLDNCFSGGDNLTVEGLDLDVRNGYLHFKGEKLYNVRLPSEELLEQLAPFMVAVANQLTTKLGEAEASVRRQQARLLELFPGQA